MEEPFFVVGNMVGEEEEYGCAVHCNATDSRPLWGGISLAKYTGIKHVVGVGRVVLGGGMGGVSSSTGRGTRIGYRKGGRGVLGK